MINRYTLQFKDQKLEEKYQEIQLREKRKPLVKKIIYLTFLVVLVKGTFSIITQSLDEIYGTIGYFVSDLCLIAILIIKPQYCRYALMFVNYLMMIPYLRTDDGKNQFHYQLGSALIVAFQFVIITSGEFIDALIQVLSIFSIYLAYFIIYQPNFSYAFVLSTFLICFLLLFSFYQNVAAERSKFQLTIINEQWDKILLSMVTEPCVIFNFDQLRHTFILKGSFSFIVKCNTNDELKNFLRKSKLTFHKKINLENYLYKQIDKFDKQDNNIINQSLIIELNQKAQEITYSIFSGTNPIILIKMDQCKCSKIIGEQQNLIIEQQFQFKYQVLLKSIYQQFKMILVQKTSNLKGLFKLIIYHYLQEKLEQKQIKQVNLSKVFSNLKLLYTQKSIILSKNLLDFTFLGYKEALFLILIEIFECNISNQVYIQINTDSQDDKQFEMLIFGIYNEKAYQILRQRLEKLQDYFNNLYLTQQYISLVITHSTFIGNKRF
ncbi:unnamed protein product [Paramecium primaurelia]|uniref:Transmembrane protein n=1 Tax=Paramecium primaurelia TaxID=5886 RepID=A0A8S1NV42_PARPR|nr:unnamed protein product [Paramecium primaurelia]